MNSATAICAAAIAVAIFTYAVAMAQQDGTPSVPPPPSAPPTSVPPPSAPPPEASSPIFAPRDSRRPLTLSVSGESEVSATPDRAVVRLGNIARADTAAAAQDSVNVSMQRVIEALRRLDIADKDITTSGISLSPVYDSSSSGRNQPRVIAFEARNTITATLDDVSRVGPILDASIKASANEVQGVTFELKDETDARSRALRQAVHNARTKAEAIAAALGMQISGIIEVAESGAQPIRPLTLGRSVTLDAATPVQPGQVQVRGSVTIVYALSDR